MLLRDGSRGLEVLLLKRSAHAGFAPGAYVFPGGVVDAEDASPEAFARVDGLTAERAAARLDVAESHPPALAYWVTAVREAVEETGILLADGGHPIASELRVELLRGSVTFAQALVRLDRRVDAGGIAYFAHWITPEPSPRRYDTRFFAAAVGSAAHAVVDGREITEARWAAPGDAVEAHGSGSLPMMLPTVRTLERLTAFPDTRSALTALADAPVVTIRPGPRVGDFAGSVAEPRLRRS